MSHDDTPSCIAIDARYVRERPSGIGTMVRALLERLPDLLPRARFLVLRHPAAPAALSSAINVEHRTVAEEANGPATLLYMKRLVDLSGIDVFHAPFNILPSGLRMATVVNVHDVMWLERPGLCSSPERPWHWAERAFYGYGIRNALRNGTRILTATRASAEAIARCHPPAAPRIRIIAQGVSQAFAELPVPDELDAIRRSVDRYARGARRYVLTVGQAAPYKNHFAVVEAFARAFHDDDSVHLVLVQRLGSSGDDVRTAARRLSVSGRVHVHGAIPHTDLVALYRGAVCLCHPSLEEGWGLPISEAQMAECPVITSRVSAMPEVAGPGAVFVNPRAIDEIATALRRLADDRWLADELRVRGRQRVRQLSWDEHARLTAEAYVEAYQATRQPTLAAVPAE